MLKQFIAISALIGVSSASFADVIGLPQVHAQALRDDPVFAAAVAQYNADKEALPMAISVLLPNISSSYAYEHVDEHTPGLASYGANTRQLSLTQPIFHHADWIALTEAKLQVKQAAATLANASQDLIYRVAQAYFKVLTAANNLAFAEKQEKTFTTLKKQAEHHLTAGIIADADLSDIQASLDNAKSQRITAANEYQTAIARLQELAPETDGQLKTLRTTAPLVKPSPENENAWVADALQNNWAIRTADLAAQIQQREIWRSQSGHAPTFDASFTYTRGNSPSYAATTASTSAGVTMTLPLFQGGAVLSQTRKAKALYEAAKNKLTLAQRQTKTAAQDAYRGVETQLSEVTALMQEKISAEKDLAATRAAYEAGANRAMTDILTSETQRLSAEHDLVQAYYDYFLNFLALKKAVGSLSAEDLTLVDQWLDSTQ
ncbi:MAG: TolC family protein [Pseudomonadota bacterium]